MTDLTRHAGDTSSQAQSCRAPDLCFAAKRGPHGRRPVAHDRSPERRRSGRAPPVMSEICPTVVTPTVSRVPTPTRGSLNAESCVEGRGHCGQRFRRCGRRLRGTFGPTPSITCFSSAAAIALSAVGRERPAITTSSWMAMSIGLQPGSTRIRASAPAPLVGGRVGFWGGVTIEPDTTDGSGLLERPEDECR